MSKKIKRNEALVLVGIALLFLVFIIVKNFFILDRISFDTRAIAGKNPGFDLNKSALTFGKVTPGFRASRSIVLENFYDKNVLVEIDSKGELSNYLYVSENDFILKPREKKEISFFVLFPKNISFREYKGKVNIILKNG